MTDNAEPSTTATDSDSGAKSAPVDDLAITHHTVTTPAGALPYTATAGRIVIREERHTDGTFQGHQPAIEMFVVAYTADNSDTATRPVTFAFNGGPGSSSVWLHLGLLGPRRVSAGDAGEPAAPPYQLIDNYQTLLAESDLVFIDPVSTGYSRSVVGSKPADYHGFTADRDAMAEMIRLWTTRNRRWLSPKFLAGESYGTLRAAALAAHLSQRIGMDLNGLMLISTVLDMGSIRFTEGNDAAYPGYLPTYAAYAHFHGLHGSRPLEEVLGQARELAERDYPWALARGSRLTPDQRADIVARIAAVSGLSADYVDRANLRVEHQHFFTELLRERGQTVGRLDGRFTGPASDRNAATAAGDVSYSAFHTPYTAAANHYVLAELNYSSDLPYEILTDRVQPWSYAEFEGRGVCVVSDLDAALRANPFLKVNLSLGYYDGATPFAAAENSLARLDLPDVLRDNISYDYYPAGHMMYLHEESRIRQSQRLARFVRDSSGNPQPEAHEEPDQPNRPEM